MFKSSILSVLSACMLLLVSSDANATEWARKMFEKTSHDFGSVARSSTAKYRFKIKNRYKETIHVASVSASCGCVIPSVSKRTLKTHETGEIIVEYNTRAFTGRRSAIVTVTFDKPYNAEVRLDVGGYIRTDVVFYPASVNFGSVDQGTKGEKKIKVSYAGRADWKISDITSAGEYYEVEMKELRRDAEAGRVDYELTIRLKDNAPAGYLQDQLTLVTKGDRAQKIPLAVEGRIIPSLAVSPASLSFGSVRVGETVTKYLIVKGKKPFTVTKVFCKDKCFDFKISEKKSIVHRIPVTFKASETPGRISHTIHIKTDQGSTAEVTCRVLALVVAKD